MLPPIFRVLKASAEVWAYVGAQQPRIYRNRLPQRTNNQPYEDPYITWFLVSGDPENNLSDPHPTQRNTVQIDCWHPKDKGVDEMADAVRSAIEEVAHVTGVVVHERDAETNLFRIGLQADFWGR